MHRLLLFLFLFCTFCSRGQDYYLIAGTYTGSGSKGIYVYRLDGKTGNLVWVSNTDEGTVKNPSYLTISQNGKYIYACTDTRTKKKGSVSSFAFNDSNGTLRFINRQPSGGANPVYLALCNSGKWLVNGNYTGGNVSVFPINGNGSIAPAKQLVQHHGSSINKDRQEKAHVHATVFSLRQDYLFVPDLGADKIMCYKFNEKDEQPLQQASIPFVKTQRGSGPRHLTFHPNGKYAYCTEELSGTVTAYYFRDSVIAPFQRIYAYEKVEAEFNSADIHISPDGKFLYASNRNMENNIAIFGIDETNGKLVPKGHTNTEGKEPRNFIITPSGDFLIVANQETGNIVVFSRDKQTGQLTLTGNSVNIPEPSCLQLLPIK